MSSWKPVRRSVLLVLVILLCIFSCGAGCVSSSIQGLTYDGEYLHILVDHPGDSCRAVLQVTVFETEAFDRDLIFKNAEYVDLDHGSNEYLIPLDLTPGTYRIFLHLFVGDDRRVGVIRELIVP